MSETLEKMIFAAKAGGAVLKKYYGENLETVEKTSSRDFCTKADIESEAVILQSLSKNFPEYNIISEEKGSNQKNSEYTFVVDPLDGTNNFVLGVPNFTVSIGLLKHDTVVAGVVYVPMIDRVYYAEEGKGAYCDETPLRVSKETEITKCTVAQMCTYNTSYEVINKIFNNIRNSNVKRITDHWSVAFDFCLLASGRTEVIINNNTEIHDFAAGRIIAREAGAVFHNFDGSKEADDKNRVFIAANTKDISQKIVDLIQ